MASMGLPGFSGFVAELQVLVGAWRANPWWTVAAGVGIVVGVAYTWRALQKAFFSDALPTAHELERSMAHEFAPITWPEDDRRRAARRVHACRSASIRAFFSMQLSRP